MGAEVTQTSKIAGDCEVRQCWLPPKKDYYQRHAPAKIAGDVHTHQEQPEKCVCMRLVNVTTWYTSGQVEFKLSMVTLSRCPFTNSRASFSGKSPTTAGSYLLVPIPAEQHDEATARCTNTSCQLMVDALQRVNGAHCITSAKRKLHHV